MYLGALGADVIKLESVQRPDGFRFSGAFPQEGDDYYDRSGIWQATNLNKRDLTLDLTRPEGRELLERLVPRADVVIENFSARVVDQFGLGYGRLRALRPDIVMVRMPGFGLEGPWRDYVGWAMGIEQASGMCAVTGEPDRPMNPGGFLDPVIGMHAAVAIQAALEHRQRTGEGQMIEIAQLEVGANLTVEQVIDWSLNRRLAHRESNRDRRFAPQGVYPCAPDTEGSGPADLPPPGDWVAISVRDDADWDGLVRALDEPDWARAPELARADGRRERHDELDDRLARWTTGRPADEVVARLRGRGVPVARQVRVDRLYDEPQLIARDYYQALDALKTGTRRYPGWPMQFSFLERPHRFGPPSLGQHNREILHGELGLDDETLRRLEAEQIIGDRLAH
jgi:crotonobetainyl-CoA:carnitine CoA-transferase CaiB-like acyl-CoA transferase